jgi:VanZ family protein
MTKTSKTIKPWLWRIVLVVSLGVIFWLAVFQTFTGEHTKDIIQHISGMTENHAYAMNVIVRKSAHILIYGLLGVLLYIVIRQHSIAYAWLGATLIAALDEWHQSFVPDRTPLAQDVILDSLSAFLFVWLFVYIKRRR